MADHATYFIGIDGGGTATRALLVDSTGAELGRGHGGPSGLALGIEHAWTSIVQAIARAFEQAGLARPYYEHIALGCGLAGVNNKQWAIDFIASDPGFHTLVVETDARTSVLGAHGGQPGAMIALGTGSVGEVMLPDGSRREVGGWGFPSSDEASGAWLGLRAINFAQRVLDGRAPSDAFAEAVIAYCGGNSEGVASWLAYANQTRYAQLAPLVIDHADDSPVARHMMETAVQEVLIMANTLDPEVQLPIALCGGLAEAMLPFIPTEVRHRFVMPQGDSVTGALWLVQNFKSDLAL